ncbi:nucleoside deaminase [Segetibacter koreensis]|uniref:nucleoside deaminase n=1 Tax=Segetibacter koreensis TaxID=398037 RepID=UPI00146EA12E|nr:nucleoside deaminase [Segetibacter koreensis]
MDNYFIKRCETLSKQAALKGNQPVGALITRNDEILSEAEEAATTKNDITCHAELEAIRLAVQQLKTNDLSDCVLYSTHEPCIMCAYAIRYHKIKKVIYQNKASYLGGASSSMPLLTTSEVPPHWGPAPLVIYLDANT